MNEEYSLEDPFLQAEEQERLEKIMMEATKLYNVTSVLKDIKRCQCGASRKKSTEVAVSTCKSCSCSKAGRICSELCSCAPETCLNRKKSTSSHIRKVS